MKTKTLRGTTAETERFHNLYEHLLAVCKQEGTTIITERYYEKTPSGIWYREGTMGFIFPQQEVLLVNDYSVHPPYASEEYALHNEVKSYNYDPSLVTAYLRIEYEDYDQNGEKQPFLRVADGLRRKRSQFPPEVKKTLKHIFKEL